jgi:hypothetical protein
MAAKMRASIRTILRHTDLLTCCRLDPRSWILAFSGKQVTLFYHVKNYLALLKSAVFAFGEVLSAVRNI